MSGGLPTEDAGFILMDGDTHTALGTVLRNKLSNGEPKVNLDNIKWLRPVEFLAMRKLDQTFEEKCVLGTEVYAEDVKQTGVLGNCWLISTLACMAQHAPELIRACFSKGPDTVLDDKVALAENGWYEVHLFNVCSNMPMVVKINDRLPCLVVEGSITPLFTDCRSAVWALLLEKAFAKMSGTYSKLESRTPLWALQIISGGANRGCQIYMKDQDEHQDQDLEQVKWVRHTLSSVDAGTDSQGSTRQLPGKAVPVTGAEPYTTEKMLYVLRDRWRIGNEHLVIAVADTAPLVDKGRKHAFTVVRVHNSTVQPGLVLVQLHNPWGRQEDWEHSWSDHSAEWTDFRQVAMEVNWKLLNKSDKGYFWMDLKDFAAHFHSLHTVRRDFSNLRVTGEFPGSMPAWARVFWEKNLANRERVPWSEFKQACEVQTKEYLPNWDTLVSEQAKQHTGRAGATFMEDVLKVALVRNSDDTVSRVALYLLQARYSKTFEPPQCMADLLKQLLQSINLSELFRSQLEEELKQLRRTLKVPEELGVQSKCSALCSMALDSRKWMLDDYDDWLSDNGSSRLLLMLAPASGGKSVFAAKLAEERKGSVQAIHFCSPSQSNVAMLCSVAVQLAQRLPSLRNHLLSQLREKELSEDKVHAASVDELFDKLLPIGAVQQVAPCQPVVVVIDELSASSRNGDGCPEVLFMLEQFKVLPAWLRIVATSRPEPYVLPGSHHAHICAPDLGCLSPSYIDEDDPNHLGDLAAYIERTLIARGFPDGEGLATATEALVQHNTPRFQLGGYTNKLQLPTEAELTAAAAAPGLVKYILQYVTGRTDHQRHADFKMWPKEQCRQLLEALDLRADTQANSRKGKRCDSQEGEHWQSLLLHGMFGLGKTTLAQHIKAVAEGVGRKVVWVSCGELAKADQFCIAIIRQLDKAGPSTTEDFEQLKLRMRSVLCKHYNILIILDDVWDHNAHAANSVIQQAHDIGGAVQVLITSRFELVQLTVSQRILLDPNSMTTPGSNGHSLAGTVLLERTFGGQVSQQQTSSKSGVDYYEQHLLEINAEWRKVIQHILGSCDGCMLAVAMIAAQLRNGGNVQSLTEWQNVAECLRFDLENRPAPANIADGENSQNNQRRTIFSAAAMSITALEKATGSCYHRHVACLQAISLFPSGVKVELPFCFVVYRALMGAAASDLNMTEGAFRSALETLCSHSLVIKDYDTRYNSNGDARYRMHDIMADFLQSKNEHNTKVDMVALCGANRSSSALSAVAVVALSGRHQCLKEALTALNISEKHRIYLAKSIQDTHIMPLWLLVPPRPRMAYESSVDAGCKCFLVAYVLGKPLALVQAALDLVECVKREGNRLIRKRLVDSLTYACRQLPWSAQGWFVDWQMVDGDAAATRRRVMQAVCAQSSTDILQLYILVYDMFTKLTAQSYTIGSEADVLNVAWVPECIATLRKLLLPWRRSNSLKCDDVYDMIRRLTDLSRSSIMQVMSLDNWRAMVELVVDAMKTCPLCEADWAAQGDTSGPGMFPEALHIARKTVSMAAHLLNTLLNTIVCRAMQWAPSTLLLDKVMEAVPYLVGMMNDNRMYGYTRTWMDDNGIHSGIGIITSLAHSPKHGQILAQDEVLRKELHYITVSDVGVSGGLAMHDKHVVTLVLDLIELHSGNATFLKNILR